MPGRHWVYVLAIGGLIASGSLAQLPLQQSEGQQPPVKQTDPDGVGSAAESETGSEQQDQSATQTPPGAQPQISAPVSPAPADQESKEGNGKADDELRDLARRDLTAQRSMAESTWQMAIAAWIGLILTLIALILIWRTLVHTRRAAQAAADAVKEAKKTTAAAIAGVKEAEKATKVADRATRQAKRQADFAEDSFKRLERPYLFVKITEIDRLLGPTRERGPYIQYVLVNHGKTPAVLRSISERLTIHPNEPGRLPTASWTERYEVIPPGKSSESRLIDVEGGQPGQGFRGNDSTKIIFRCAIQYEDAAGTLFHDGFGLCANKDANSWRGYGGQEYNYRGTIKPTMGNHSS